jgi:hypothetical protein
MFVMPRTWNRQPQFRCGFRESFVPEINLVRGPQTPGPRPHSQRRIDRGTCIGPRPNGFIWRSSFPFSAQRHVDNVVCCQLTIRVYTVALLSVKICLIQLESFVPVTRPIPVEFWLDLPNELALPVCLRRAASQVALSFTHFGGEEGVTAIC